MRQLILALALTAACAPTASARFNTAQSALNVLTDVVDPAYEATRVGCDAAEVAAVALAELNEISYAELDIRIRENRDRCNKVITIYEAMIDLQRAAREALEMARVGDEQALNQAEETIRAIRRVWQEKPPVSP